MIIGDFGRRELIENIRGKGLPVSIGTFVFHVWSNLKEITDYIVLAYGNYSVVSSQVADYRVGVIPRCFPWRVDFWADGHRPFHSFPRQQAAALLEWGMNWCVYRHAHQFLVVHAAVVELNGRGFIFPGRSGAGKSTLCATLVSRGWRLLSDELALIRPLDGALMPMPRPISLKGDTIDLVKETCPNLEFIGDFRGTRKGRVGLVRVPRESIHSQHRIAFPAIIVFPKFGYNFQFRPSQVSKSKALLRVARNAFNYQLLEERGFELLCNVVDSCGFYEMVYSDAGEAAIFMEELAEEKQESVTQDRWPPHN